jgi:acylphosphatase
MKTAARITVTGLVQGVGYRWFVYKRASELDLKGLVRNQDDGSVYVEVEGDKTLIEVLIEKLKKGPTFSRVTDVHTIWDENQNQFSNFYIAD